MAFPSAVTVPAATLVPMSFTTSGSISGVVPLLEVTGSVATNQAGS